jgi:hypothetical protein
MPKPIALKGVLTVESDMPIGWRRAKPGVLRIGIDATDTLLTPDPLEVDLGCNDVRLIEREYVARASITKQQKLTKLDVTRDGVELRAEPKGDVTATLKAGVQVELLQQKGAQARILVDASGYFVSGWVARKDLVASQQTFGGGRGAGMGYGRGVGNIRTMLSCDADVELHLEQGSERMKVGKIHARARFVPRPSENPDDRFIGFDMPSLTWLFLDESARLVVEKQSVEGCKQDGY